MDIDAKFDTARLAELEEDFGAEDLGFVIEAFLEEAEEAVSDLAELTSPEKTSDCVSKLHFLVGAARNIGASSFGQLCQQHEKASAGFSEADYRTVLSEFVIVKSWMQRRIASTESDAA